MKIITKVLFIALMGSICLQHMDARVFLSASDIAKGLERMRNEYIGTGTINKIKINAEGAASQFGKLMTSLKGDLDNNTVRENINRSINKILENTRDLKEAYVQLVKGIDRLKKSSMPKTTRGREGMPRVKSRLEILADLFVDNEHTLRATELKDITNNLKVSVDANKYDIALKAITERSPAMKTLAIVKAGEAVLSAFNEAIESYSRPTGVITQTVVTPTTTPSVRSLGSQSESGMTAETTTTHGGPARGEASSEELKRGLRDASPL